MPETEPEVQAKTFDCGHVRDCWCGLCHVCEDVTQDETGATDA